MKRLLTGFVLAVAVAALTLTGCRAEGEVDTDGRVSSAVPVAR